MHYTAATCTDGLHAHFAKHRDSDSEGRPFDRSTAARLRCFVDTVDSDAAPAVRAVLNFCWNDALRSARTDLSVRRALCYSVALPLMQRSNVALLELLLCEPSAEHQQPAIRLLVQAVSGKAGGGAGAAQQCAYALLEHVFDTFPLHSIKGPLTRAYAGRADVPEQELYRDIIKAVNKLWRSGSSSSSGTSSSSAGGSSSSAATAASATADERYLRCAALSCLATIVRVTQVKEDMFDKLVWSKLDASIVDTEHIRKHKLKVLDFMRLRPPIADLQGAALDVRLDSRSLRRASAQGG
jgi:hypothetical protein